MSRLVLSLALALGAPLGCARGGGQPAAVAPVASAEEGAAVRGAVERWRQALEVRSVEALGEVYAHDEALVVVQQGAATRGWQAVSRQLEEQLAKAREVRLRLDELMVTPVGEGGAVVVGRLQREISDGVTSVAEDGTLTLTLRQDGAAWVIVSQHYSYPVR